MKFYFETTSCKKKDRNLKVQEDRDSNHMRMQYQDFLVSTHAFSRAMLGTNLNKVLSRISGKHVAKNRLAADSTKRSDEIARQIRTKSPRSRLIDLSLSLS